MVNILPLKNMMLNLTSYNVDNTEKDIELLLTYMEEILELNKQINLTNIVNKNEFIQKHYMDSISICNLKEFEKSKKIVDIGTGAGFPGIPLAILYKDKNFLLVDSLKKRLDIIDKICKNLNVKNVKTLHIRAEELGRGDERESFDLVVSRAVANLSSLSELCLPLVKLNGWFLSYKGEKVNIEIDEAQKALEKLGGKIHKIYDTSFENQKNHYIISVKKIKNTDDKYPRKSGIPTKRPIK